MNQSDLEFCIKMLQKSVAKLSQEEKNKNPWFIKAVESARPNDFFFSRDLVLVRAQGWADITYEATYGNDLETTTRTTNTTFYTDERLLKLSGSTQAALVAQSVEKLDLTLVESESDFKDIIRKSANSYAKNQAYKLNMKYDSDSFRINDSGINYLSEKVQLPYWSVSFQFKNDRDINEKVGIGVAYYFENKFYTYFNPYVPETEAVRKKKRIIKWSIAGVILLIILILILVYAL